LGGFTAPAGLRPGGRATARSRRAHDPRPWGGARRLPGRTRATARRRGSGTTTTSLSSTTISTRVLICRDDRLFPARFLRRIARERLGVTPDEIDGGHPPALSRPKELADRLDAYTAEHGLFSNRGAG